MIVFEGGVSCLKSYKDVKLKISAIVWDDELELIIGAYLTSDIMIDSWLKEYTFSLDSDSASIAFHINLSFRATSTRDTSNIMKQPTKSI